MALPMALRAAILLTTPTLSSLLYAQSAPPAVSTLEGIWQNTQHTDAYYAVHINDAGDRLLLIDLAGLEKSGETLRSSYHGPISDSGSGYWQARLRPLQQAPVLPASADVTAPAVGARLYINWGCAPGVDMCVGIVQELRKVF